jgi:5'-methylthioadenosine phosphorylase
MDGIIGGTSLMGSSLFEGWAEQSMETPHGSVKIRSAENIVFIQRHGDPAMPPHRINHRANIWALKNFGIRRIISINSVGSLKAGLKPGALVMPHDFISPWQIATFFDDQMHFMVPVMDENLISYLSDVCREAGVAVQSGGVYIQTIGPRLETKAEIRMLKRFGDIIGMTMASEATLSMECEIPYISLCSIDNYCNGIVRTPLTMEEIKQNVFRNRVKIEKVIQTLIVRKNA